MTKNESLSACSRCGLPLRMPQASSKQALECEHCQDFCSIQKAAQSYPQELLRQRLEAARRKDSYDCLVGLSGGKDSAYVALRLRRDYQMKILACTFDNGFLNDYARKNIEACVRDLELDHIWIRVDPVVHKKLYRAALLRLGQPCLACAWLCAIALHKTAFERAIPLIIHGRSRAQMFKAFSHSFSDPFQSFVLSNLLPPDAVRIKEVSLMSLTRSKRLLGFLMGHGSLAKAAEKAFFPDMKSWKAAAAVPELIGLFLYERYDENAMKDRLERETSWQRPQRDRLMGHGDCAIHNAAEALHIRMQGYPLLRRELSAAIRDGSTSRGNAQLSLEAQKAELTQANEELQFLREHLHVSQFEFAWGLHIAKILRRFLEKLPKRATDKEEALLQKVMDYYGIN